ncbi:SDR family oxidoreductase [Williamsia sp. CHRR-6]|uniref:SDR family oxidoreductase n=1 Tax=Williamsia sp. CHRR-6 TaxID=2835871 RepID=UPI001BD98573|nr:SDR family oxidoreductase [Williamsia sp. CHRR-6]MBT0566976.1 SDR family oxidoreductase [Williamsia sp. CHRR-6]
MNATALITGASRGTGARLAALMADADHDVVVHYRSREVLAHKVVRDIEGRGRRAWPIAADLVEPGAPAALAEKVAALTRTVNVLILNASGGLEPGHGADYPTRMNVTAQVATLRAITPLMPEGSRVVFVTSHHAHFHPAVETLPEYRPIAASKRAGESAVRDQIPELARRGISLVVVSGDVVARTATAVMLERAHPDTFARRRARGDDPLTINEFAAGVAGAALDRDKPTGHTVYVGATN